MFRQQQQFVIMTKMKLSTMLSRVLIVMLVLVIGKVLWYLCSAASGVCMV